MHDNTDTQAALKAQEAQFAELEEEDLKKLRARLERENIPITNEETNGDATLTEYSDKDGSRVAVVTFRTRGNGHSCTTPQNHPLHNWKNKLDDDGLLICSSPSDANNFVKSGFKDDKYILDITNYKGPKSLQSAKLRDGEKVSYTITENGEIEIRNVEGNLANRVFFKRGEQTLTLDNAGNLVEFKENIIQNEIPSDIKQEMGSIMKDVKTPLLESSSPSKESAVEKITRSKNTNTEIKL